MIEHSRRPMPQILDGNPITWSYDDLYRLTGQQKAGQVCTYTVDGVGNLRTMWEGGSSPKTFTFDAADRLVTMVEGANLTTYSYTGYGALASETIVNKTTTYSYSGQDQLIGVLDPSGVRSTYTFDGDGMRRAAQEGNVQPTTMVWDGSDYLYLKKPGNQSQVVLTLDAEIVACGTKDLLTDPLGSLVREISAGASLSSLFQFYPYGAPVGASPANAIPFQFVGAYGYYTDSASRDYVRARELMKKLGRWMQVDALWPRLPVYSYVACSPTNLTDRFGLAPGVGTTQNLSLAAPGNLPRELCRDLNAAVWSYCTRCWRGMPLNFLDPCYRQCDFMAEKYWALCKGGLPPRDQWKPADSPGGPIVPDRTCSTLGRRPTPQPPVKYDCVQVMRDCIRSIDFLDYCSTGDPNASPYCAGIYAWCSLRYLACQTWNLFG